MEFLLHILAGATVGFAIGLTGVGGGSLMTPLLLVFGYPAPVAIGTDL
ncbi:MAG: sulfite exporter TauE/SafE family protein, partial [Pseudomonadota bacterium]|nr:sulfite exporter TauE/SafE family protein [Pseudomonadota bacterium]